MNDYKLRLIDAKHLLINQQIKECRNPSYYEGLNAVFMASGMFGLATMFMMIALF